MDSIKTKDYLFDQIKGLIHYPWVGEHYYDQKYRILIVGDSHYTVDDDGNYCEEEYYRCLNDKEYTREIVNCARSKEPWNMFKGLYSLFDLSDELIDHNLWSKVSFINFIQEPMRQRSAVPTDTDFKKAWFCLLDLIDILQPQICLFIGIRGWRGNGYINNEKRGTCVLKDDTVRISNCTPWIATIETLNGNKTKAIAIHHTSQGFSPDKWREYLQFRCPELMQTVMGV